MGLIYCGIDEAGFGPLLGPLCVAMTAFRVEEWSDGEPAPDLWKRLKACVGRTPRPTANGKRSRGVRIAVEDSKKLKLANDCQTHDPLVHLERGVLSFLSCHRREGCDGSWLGAGDVGYYQRVGVIGGPAGERVLERPWYVGDALPCPRELSIAQVHISSNVLLSTLEKARVDVEHVGVRVLEEGEFNRVTEAAGTKAAATETALREHLGLVWERFARPCAERGDTVVVVCDRQGGRTQYAGLIGRALGAEAGAIEIDIKEESARASRYEVRERAGTAGTAPRCMRLLFMPEAESAHLPVALASMSAKLTRELLMARFNRYWSARVPELKPTAGYRGDAWRWLKDLGERATEQERREMVRRC